MDNTNLFDTAPTNLFEDGLAGGPISVPPKDPVKTARTARMAALATAPAQASVQDIIGSLDATTAGYKKQIDTIGEGTLRMQIAAQQQIDSLKSIQRLSSQLTTFDQDQSLRQGTALMAQQLMQEDITNRAKYALEQETITRVQNLAASGDTVQARLMINNLQMGGPADVIRDTIAKRLVLQNAIQASESASKDEPWYLHFADFLMGIIPFKGSMGQVGNVEIDKAAKHWYDNVFAGNRVQLESATLWDMPLKDFTAYVNGDLMKNLAENSTLFGYHNRSEELNLLTSLQRAPAPWMTNTFNGLDNFGMIPISKLGKIGEITSLLVRNGARKEAAGALADTIRRMSATTVEEGAQATGIQLAEVADNTLPTLVNPTLTPLSVPLGADVEPLLRGQELADQLMPEIMQPGRLLPEEQSQAIAALRQRIEEQLGTPLKDITPVATTLSGGIKTTSLELTVGRDAGGFGTKKAAKGWAESLGLPTDQIFKDSSGQWFVKFSRPLTEMGMFTAELEPQAKGFVSRILKSASNLSDVDLDAVAQTSGAIRAKLYAGLKTEYAAVFRSLTGAERSAFEQVAQAGEREGQWFTESQLGDLWQAAFKRAPTTRELKAYQAFRNVNDLEYALRNDETFKLNHIKGKETVEFEAGQRKMPPQNGLVDRSMSTVPNGWVYDTSSGTHFTPTNRMTKEVLADLKAKGYVMVHLDSATKLVDGNTVRSFIVRASSLKTSPLERIQLGYRAGGHRIYKDPWFAKQARVIRQIDGTQMLDNPATFITGTKAEVKFWSDAMEKARQYVLSGGDDPNFIDSEIFRGHAGLPTGESFLSDITSGVLEKDHSFEAVYDRELPSIYGNVSKDLHLGDEIEEETGFQSWLRTNGKLYSSPKGEILKDWQGRDAKTLDVYKTINQSLSNIANVISFSDYKIQSLERWVNTFKSALNPDTFKGTSSSYQIFKDAAFKSTISNEVRQAALAQKEVINRILGWKSPLDREAEQLNRDFVDWVHGDVAGSTQQKVGRYATDWWEDKNPVRSVRSMAFDMKLGFFNILQLPLQAGTAVAALSMSPKLGMKGFALYPALRHYLSKAGTDNALDYYVKSGWHKLAGFDSVSEFKDFMKLAKRQGFFEVEGSHALVNDFGPNASIGQLGKAVDGIREKGRFFFNEGEIMNRVVAQRIAWGELRESLPTLSTKSEDFLNKLTQRANHYSLMMTEQSQASWQKGLLSIPTQFWAYNARMLEAMLPEWAGGSGAFSKTQKMRLVVGQTLLYGSAGIPAVEALSSMWKNSHPDPTGKETGIQSIYGFLDRGGLDEAIYHMTGQDVLVGKRFGTGSWVSDLIEEMFGQSPYGEVTPFKIATGATGSIAVDTLSALGNVAKYTAAEAGGDLGYNMTEDAILKAASNISTVGNLTKGYLVWNYGTLRTKNGSTISTTMPKQSAFAVALGIQPGLQDQVSQMMTYRKNENKSVDEAVKVIVNLRTRYVNEPDNRQEITESINVFTKLLPPDIRTKALHKAQGRTPKGLYESLAEQFQKDQAQKQMIEENQP